MTATRYRWHWRLVSPINKVNNLAERDYPDIVDKMPNMTEWWLCLTMSPDEIEQITLFKKLTEKQKAVLLSASKLSRCYTERSNVGEKN
uniref:hypothetical protein n=1 Tax=Photorhabdus sp. CRCIA-P01 TaxID=2019570 RepID=UPI001E337A67|nr:hypothetical protein [Photorhabdus sp. CRCIA-P01]